MKAYRSHAAYRANDFYRGVVPRPVSYVIDLPTRHNVRMRSVASSPRGKTVVIAPKEKTAIRA